MYGTPNGKTPSVDKLNSSYFSKVNLSEQRLCLDEGFHQITDNYVKVPKSVAFTV